MEVQSVKNIILLLILLITYKEINPILAVTLVSQYCFVTWEIRTFIKDYIILEWASLTVPFISRLQLRRKYNKRSNLSFGYI